MFWTKKKSYLLFGAGAAAQNHISLLKGHPFKMKAVFNPSGQSPPRIKSDVIRSLTELDKNIFDFAVIASPNCFHFEQILYLIDRKIPFIVEKPVVSNRDQLNRLKNIKSMAAKYCMVAHNLRFQANTIFLKQWLADNKKIPHTIDVEWKRNIQKTETSWNSDSEKSGGGILLDWGSHAIDLAWYLIDEKSFETIRAVLLPKNNQIEETAVLSQQSKKSGIIANIALSWDIEDEAKKPLQIKLHFENNTVSWHKSGQITLTEENKTSVIFNNNKNLMYEHFSKYFLTQEKDLKQSTDLLSRSLKVTENIINTYNS